MSELQRVRRWAEALIDAHLDASWSFAFDNAKRRAGLCDYTRKRISVSRYLSARYDDDTNHQTLLHEVAHALAGAKAGHGPRWKKIATDLGYEGKRLHDGAIADELAPWVGACPAGHVHYRYKRPTRIVSCAICSKKFDLKYQIEWRQRSVQAAQHRVARPAGAEPVERAS